MQKIPLLAITLISGLATVVIAQNQPLASTTSGVGPAKVTAFSADGELYLVWKPDGHIKIMRASDGVTLHHFLHCNPRRAIFSPNGRFLSTAGTGNGAVAKIKIWDLQKNVLVRAIKTEVTDDSLLAFSPDSKTLATTSADSELYVWDTATGELKHWLCTELTFTGINFGKTSQTLLAIHTDGTTRQIAVE